ncbi:hypothetical protein WJX73_002025 [Symbiochloris irregularis]|uniref:RRM domain-containing protein n=1 Tax=Symbiochloris irregularis TaxID=706552 RepID=A0AAW1NKR2_9CHLO
MSAEPEEQNGHREEKAAAAPEENKLFVGGISWHMNDRELKDTFRKYGPCEARVMADKITGRSRGFGFVIFESTEDMEAARKELHDSEIDGRKVSVTIAIPQSETAPGTPASHLGTSRHRGYDRGYDRAPRSAGYERGYDRRYPGYERGYDRGFPPERGYDRGAYPPEYDRYERGAPPPGYAYDREYDYDSRAPSYSRGGYPPDRYAAYDAPYERDPAYDYERYPQSYDRYPPAERGYPPSDRAYSRGTAEAGPAARTSSGSYDRAAPAGYDRYASRGGGPDRDYGRPPPSSRAGPYERSGVARDDRGSRL